MRLFSTFKILLGLAVFLPTSFSTPAIASDDTTSNITEDGWVRYKNFKLKFDLPENWRVERDLYGMPIMVLGPERDGERAVLSVQDTPMYGMEFDHALIQKTKDQYYQGRKNWLAENDDDARFVGEIPYRHLKWSNGNDGFELGFRYHMRNLNFEERSAQINCNHRLYLVKTLSSDKLPKEDSEVLAKLVNQLQCASPTKNEGAYEPGPLQDLVEKVDAQMGGGIAMWPTQKQMRTASPEAKAVMLESVVEFYKSYEEAAGEDLYSKLQEPKEDRAFAKIKDRTDKMLSFFMPKSFANEGYDCFFGGWPSKIVKSGGGYTCGYPWNTNEQYKNIQTSCGDGQMACNPSLFGDHVCIDVNTSAARQSATLHCEMRFRAMGKTYESVLQEPAFDQSVLEKTVDAAEDVCGDPAYASSNMGLCQTLKEKLNISISNAKVDEEDKDITFINDMDAIKPDNYDQSIKATQENINEFEKRCVDDQQQLRKEVPGCIEDAGALYEDLNRISRNHEEVGQELGEVELEDIPYTADDGDDEDVVPVVQKNKNCVDGNCGTSKDPTKNFKTPKKEKAKKKNPDGCTDAQVAHNKKNECSWSTLLNPIEGAAIGGKCLYNIVTGLLKSLWNTIKGIGELIWDGAKWVGNKFVQAGKWFAGLFGYEDQSAKKMHAAAKTSNSFIKELIKDPGGTIIRFFKGIWEGIQEFLANDVFCQEWENPWLPHMSKCKIPATSWACLSCKDRINGSCSAVGFLIGELAPAFFTGGLTLALKGTALTAKVVGWMSKAQRAGKLVKFTNKIATKFPKAATASKIRKYGSKVEKTLVKEADDIAQDVNILGKNGEKIKTVKNGYRGAKTSPLSRGNRRIKDIASKFKSKVKTKEPKTSWFSKKTRWTRGKQRKVAQTYRNADKAIKEFKTAKLGRFDKAKKWFKDVHDKYFIVKGGVATVNWAVVKPVKKIAKAVGYVVSTPVRIPRAIGKGNFWAQGESFKSGLKYGEKLFNKKAITFSTEYGPLLPGVKRVSDYGKIPGFIAKYSTSFKYINRTKDWIIQDKENLGMGLVGGDNDQVVDMVAGLTPEQKILNRARLMGKNITLKDIENKDLRGAKAKDLEEVKAGLRKDHIDDLTNKAVKEALSKGEKPEPSDLQYLAKLSKTTPDGVWVKQIEDRIAELDPNQPPVFYQQDYEVYARWKTKQGEKMNAADAKVILLNEAEMLYGKEPGVKYFETLGKIRGQNPTQVRSESVEERLMLIYSGAMPNFYPKDFEAHAQWNGTTVQEAERYVKEEIALIKAEAGGTP